MSARPVCNPELWRTSTMNLLQDFSDFRLMRVLVAYSEFHLKTRQSGSFLHLWPCYWELQHQANVTDELWMHKQPIHIQHDGSASESLFHVSSAVILERLILQEMPSINRLMLSEQNNIFTEVHFPSDLKSVFPQTEICICVGAQQCVNMNVSLVVCGEKRVSTLRVSVYPRVCVWVCIHVCVHVRVCVLPGCVWLCQAIWSAVWGVHYPLSCAVGSGVHSICPSSLLFVPPSVFFIFLFIFCSTFLPIPLYFS